MQVEAHLILKPQPGLGEMLSLGDLAPAASAAPHHCTISCIPVAIAIQDEEDFFSINNLEACIFHRARTASENPNGVDGRPGALTLVRFAFCAKTLKLGPKQVARQTEDAPLHGRG